MLILVPPSEGKTRPVTGRRLTRRSLAFPTLTATRKQLLDTVDPGLAAAPAAPAIEVYSGVLYAALAATTLTPTQRARLDDQVLIASALFGLLRPGDRIPGYSLPPNSRVRGRGSLASIWRDEIIEVLDHAHGPILDLRSGAYQALGPLPNGAGAVGRVLLERHGKRSVVSHHNKATKGRAVRALMTSRSRHSTIEDVATTLETAGMKCEIHSSNRGPVTIDIITYEL